MAENGERPAVEGARRPNSAPLSFGSIPIPTREGKGGASLSIYPPGAWFDSPAFIVFVGGCGYGERQTLPAAQRFLLECALAYCDTRATEAQARADHYREQSRLLAANGLTPSTVGRAPETAPGQSPRGAAGQSGG